MRILHTSDWHLGRTLENISRLQEQQQFIDELVQIAKEVETDLVLVAGDIFDTYNPSSAAEELFYQAVDRLSDRGRRAVAVIAGNHDSPERLCAASPLAYKNGVVLLGYPNSSAKCYPIEAEGVKLIDAGPGWLELGLSSCGQAAVIAAVPYPSESRLDEVLSAEIDESALQQAYSDRIGRLFHSLAGQFRKDTVNLLMSHLFLMGGRESDSERTLQVGGAMTVSPAAIPEGTQYAAFGHLHRPQWIKSSCCPAIYSGSPLAYSFSEADYSKAVFMVDVEPRKEATVEQVLLRSGRPLRKWVAKEGILQAVSWCEEGKDKGAFVDLEIHTDRTLTAEEQKRLRDLNPGIINIRPHINTEDMEASSPEGRETRRIDELFGDYYRFKTGMELPEELLKTFLEVLYEGEEKESIAL